MTGQTGIIFMIFLFGTLHKTKGYNEPPCLNQGGNCQYTFKPCPTGEYVNHCPTQPWYIKCCRPHSVKVFKTCDALGGTCMSPSRCPGLSVANLCPGTSVIQCCVKTPNAGVIEQHLNRQSGGIHLTGYLSGPKSGVHIATNVDLSRYDVDEFRNMGLSKELINKISPYLGLTFRYSDLASLKNDLPQDLILSFKEARELDQAVLARNLEKISPFVGKLGLQGIAVLNSLFQWCGGIILASPENKCFMNKCPYFLGEVLVSGNQGEEELLKALEYTVECGKDMKAPSENINRLLREIDFIDTNAA